jgi:serine/threonine-protein kinase
MSPEQVRASKHVGPRTDVWSIGCVLYELLAGEPPFAAPSVMSLTSIILSEAPRSVRRRRPDVPPELEAVILRCLEKRQEARWPSMIDLAIALEPFGRPNLNGRLVESLRRLQVAAPAGASPSGAAGPRRSLKSIPIVVPAKRGISAKVILVTGAATFALVLLIVFVVDRALHH